MFLQALDQFQTDQTKVAKAVHADKSTIHQLAAAGTSISAMQCQLEAVSTLGTLHAVLQSFPC